MKQEKEKKKEESMFVQTVLHAKKKEIDGTLIVDA
jgi:hypothetical protein